MKAITTFFVISVCLFLFGCPSEKKEDIKPVERKVVETLKMHLDSTGKLYLQQYDYGVPDRFSSMQLDTYFETLKKSQGHTFYMTLATPEECQNRNMECSQYNNIKIDFSKAEIMAEGLPNNKYSLSGFGGFYFTKNSIISIYTLDQTPIFTAKTATKDYKVNRIEFEVGTLDFKEQDAIGQIYPSYYSRCGSGDAGLGNSASIYDNKFKRYWEEDDGSKKQINGHDISLRTVDELKKMLKLSSEQKFSIIRKGCPTKDFSVQYLFHEKVTLN